MSASGGAASATGHNQGGTSTVNMSKSFGATSTGSIVGQNVTLAIIAVVVIGFLWLMFRKKSKKS